MNGRFLGFLALAMAAGSASAVEACDGTLVWGLPYSYRTVHTDRHIPYFAEFPPVYYSYPIPRTYGYSPYAYLPTVMTPPVEFLPEPETVENPYLPQSLQQPVKDHTASRAAGPQVVLNPFVGAASRLATVDSDR